VLKNEKGRGKIGCLKKRGEGCRGLKSREEKIEGLKKRGEGWGLKNERSK
jgi:hypothetical protein